MYLSFFEFILLGFATFRLTRLIVFDQITEWMRSPFMREIEEQNEEGENEIYIVPKIGGISGFFGKLLSCYWCAGVWCSVILCVLYFVIPFYGMYIILVLAVAGIASIIETLVQMWLPE
ncbi:DUF1360 domain-containing protein [Cytobacillus purgationiresistens]|uniref:Sporulation protein n=1 Tax=Cytobacillus purgationiresistens TaxID=863449 RepID=A0ABU0ACE2_9BACI|nr:DUF1360 domain-containing protein [Cytobacillus purgationiresistens]MDQ0268710.1 hypothetical protein [Cytobacillus purgationiresistens]